MASHRADRAMEELAKANNSIAKLGGDAIAREATMAKMQKRLEKFRESSQKAQEKIIELQNKDLTNIRKIASLKREALKLTSDLEIEKGQASSSGVKLKEIEGKA